jgi:hypothetical protein
MDGSPRAWFPITYGIMRARCTRCTERRPERRSQRVIVTRVADAQVAVVLVEFGSLVWCLRCRAYLALLPACDPGNLARGRVMPVGRARAGGSLAPG